MAYEQPPNRGTLFPNDKKESEKHPDYKGDFNIDGVNYWISAWEKEGKRGTFISFSVEKKKAPDVNKMADQRAASEEFQRPQHKAGTQAPPLPFDQFDDDIPF